MQRNHTTMSYLTFGSEALKPVRVRNLVLIEGAAHSQSPQAPNTYHEQATSRGNRVVSTTQGILAFCAALLVVVAIFAASLVKDSYLVLARTDATTDIALEEVVVMPGDSLWQIAEAHPVDGLSTADTVTYIVESNGLSSSCLQIGQVLLVPSS